MAHIVDRNGARFLKCPSMWQDGLGLVCCVNRQLLKVIINFLQAPEFSCKGQCCIRLYFLMFSQVLCFKDKFATRFGTVAAESD